MVNSPSRVVSLVPSLTELVVTLGRGQRLVGRTKFCVEPREALADVPAFGGTKNPKIDAIVASRPDLVIANREENRREDVNALLQAGIAVLVTDPSSVAGARALILELGEILDARSAAEALSLQIDDALRNPPPARRPRVFVPIWRSPWMGLGGDSYGHDLITVAGAINVLAGRPRYPEVTLDEIASLAPDLVLLPDEPYPFDASHVAELAHIAPAEPVDGKLLWWYGPRTPAAIRHVRALFSAVAL